MTEDNHNTHDEVHTLRGWQIAMELFVKHCGPDVDFPFGADHEVIYGPASLDDIPADSDDGKTLRSLGWHVDVEFNCWARFV